MKLLIARKRKEKKHAYVKTTQNTRSFLSQPPETRSTHHCEDEEPIKLDLWPLSFEVRSPDEVFHQRTSLHVRHLFYHVIQQLLMVWSDSGQEEIRLELNTGNRSDA